MKCLATRTFINNFSKEGKTNLNFIADHNCAIFYSFKPQSSSKKMTDSPQICAQRAAAKMGSAILLQVHNAKCLNHSFKTLLMIKINGGLQARATSGTSKAVITAKVSVKPY